MHPYHRVIPHLCSCAVGFKFDIKSIFISDSIHLATEVAYHRYYSRCSWPCHASLFLWLLRKQRDDIRTGVEERRVCCWHSKDLSQQSFISVQWRGRTCRSRSARSRGNPRTELALFLTIETGSAFTKLGHFFTPFGCHKFDILLLKLQHFQIISY